MKILIDTHALLWFFNDDPRLSKKAKETYLDTKNKLYFSMASLWELGIKISLKKITLKKDWYTQLTDQLYKNSISWLPILPDHCHQTSLLPFHHRDPFDRMILAQALIEKMPVLTADTSFKDYHVNCMW